MPSFGSYSELDEPIVQDGDDRFVGIHSHIEGDKIQPSYVKSATNTRMDEQEVTVRKGLDFQAGMSGVSPTYTYSAGDEEVFASGRYSDPDDDKQDWLVSATKQAALIWDGTDTYYVNYYSADIAAGSVDHPTDVWGAPAHKFQVGDAVQLTTTDTLPTGVAVDTTYYVIDFSASSIKLATSYANALAGTPIDITSAGVGTHTVQSIVDTSHAPEIIQAFNQVYILRYKNRPLVWDGVTTATGDVVNSVFESLSSTVTLQTGAAGTGDPFPSTNTGAYIANRLIGVQPRGIATPTEAVTDSSTVILSDLLEPNQVTPANSEWYINQGAADYVVGFTPYQENNMLIFNRRSITMATNVHDTENSVRYQITERYGCIAKRTITQAGGFIYFLSDDGVMQLNPALDIVTGAGAAVSKMQGALTPLSLQIQDLLRGAIESTDVADASGIVWDNKFYLAIPFTASNLTQVFVYDLINGAWVSQDQYTSLQIQDLKLIDNDNRERLVICTAKGWYWAEENDGLDDTNRTIGSSAESNTTAISAILTTRAYNFGTQESKHFQDIKVGLKISDGDVINIGILTYNPTRSETLETYTHSGGSNDYVERRLRTRVRGTRIRVTFSISAGSPIVQYIRVSGAMLDSTGGRSLD